MMNKNDTLTYHYTDSLRKGMTMPRLLLLCAEVIVFAILAVVASSHFGMADGARITLAYLVAYLIPRIILTKARGSSIPAHIVLLVLAIILMSIDFFWLKKWTFFDDYSLQMPNLLGDSRGYYKWALNKYYGREVSSKVIFPGFPLMLVALWKMFGVSVIWPQAMNLTFTLTSVVLSGMTTRRLLSHRVSVSPAVLVTGGMVLTCLLMFYFSMGLSILKEATIFISMAMAGFALAAMDADDKERHHPWRDFTLFVLACALLGIVRTTYLYFVLVGVAVMTVSHLRRNWQMAIAMVVVIALALVGGNELSSYSFDRHAEIAGGGWNMQRFYVTSESQRFYNHILNYYFLYSFWHKLVMLPLTMSVQFVIPFPWTYYENSSFLNILERMTYGWYVIGGISLFYFFYVSWRRRDNMGAWPWWAALCFAAMAYVMAGSVARYVTPIQPLFVPVAVYVLCRLWEGRWRKAFLYWSIFFVILMALTLCFCLEIQQATFSKMLHTRSLAHYIEGIPY